MLISQDYTQFMQLSALLLACLHRIQRGTVVLDFLHCRRRCRSPVTLLTPAFAHIAAWQRTQPCQLQSMRFSHPEGLGVMLDEF